MIEAFDFETWGAKFAKLGAYPRIWTVAEGPAQREKVLEHACIAFPAAEAQFSRRIGSWRIRFSPPLADEPEAIRALEEQLAKAFLSGGLRQMPPFYPGSRVSFTFLSPNREIAGGIAGAVPDWIDTPKR